MFYKSNNTADEEIDIEALRWRLIRELEAAYFGGIGPAVVSIADVKYADKDELLRIAGEWGLR